MWKHAGAGGEYGGAAASAIRCAPCGWISTADAGSEAAFDKGPQSDLIEQLEKKRLTDMEFFFFFFYFLAFK